MTTSIPQPGPQEPPRTKPAEKTAFYRPELDSLRFFAFVAVLLAHYLPRSLGSLTRRGMPEGVASWFAGLTSSGVAGVDLFFVLSAYLITELLTREIKSTGALSISGFYARRVLRIWPLYYLFLILSVTLVPRLLPADSLPTGHFVMFLVLAGNWACVLWGYPQSAASPLWSVSVEEQFYLSWPLLLSRIGTRGIAVTAVALIVVSNVLRVVLVWQDAPYTSVWCNTLARLDPIAAGTLISVCLKGSIPRTRGLLRLILFAGSLVLWAAAGRYCAREGVSSLAFYPVVALGSAGILLAVIGSESRLVTFPPLVYLGRISYGLYVYHVLALALVLRYVVPGGVFGMVFQRFLGVALTLALAALSYRFFERPFLKLKSRFARVLSAPV